MQTELEALQPKLKIAAEETAAMMIDLTEQQKEADTSRGLCEIEEAKCTEEAAAAQAIKDECEAALAVAMPAFNDAIKALNTITKNDMVEVK
jgi:dynein heavy chain